MIILNFMPYPHGYGIMILIMRLFYILGITSITLGFMTLSFKVFDFIATAKEIQLERAEVMLFIIGIFSIIFGGYTI